MKLKHLEAALQDMEIFEQPKVHLEQYPTTPHLAACVLYEAHNKFDDIQDRAVLDLGCGTCMLSTAAKILGAGYVCGADIDGDALKIAQRNMEEMDVDIDLVQCDVAQLAFRLATSAAHTAGSAAAAAPGSQASETTIAAEKEGEKQYQCEFDCGFTGSFAEVEAHEASCAMGNGDEDDVKEEQEQPEAEDSTDKMMKMCLETDGGEGLARGGEAGGAGAGARGCGRWREGSFDTVLMNPPFGTRRRGMDMLFLYAGLCLARRAVYSMHKTSTREGIAKKVGEWGVTYEVIAELKFDLPASYDFHKRASVQIAVDLVRLQVPTAWANPCPSPGAGSCAHPTLVHQHRAGLIAGLRELAIEVGSNRQQEADEAGDGTRSERRVSSGKRDGNDRGAQRASAARRGSGGRGMR